MIEAPVALVLAWLLGLGDRSGPSAPPRRNGGGGAAPVEDLPDVGAWPRAIPSGGEQAMRQTGGQDPVAWRRAVFDAAKTFLSMDDRSVNALTNLYDQHLVESGNYDIDQIALAVVTHWDIETASGTHEFNYNVGGVMALPGQTYFASTDVQSNQQVAFASYPDEVTGIADYFGVLSKKRYASALAALLMLPTDPGWFSELGWAGYFGMDPVKAEKLWTDRRASVAVDVGMSP